MASLVFFTTVKPALERFHEIVLKQEQKSEIISRSVYERKLSVIMSSKDEDSAENKGEIQEETVRVSGCVFDYRIFDNIITCFAVNSRIY